MTNGHVSCLSWLLAGQDYEIFKDSHMLAPAEWGIELPAQKRSRI